MAPMGWYVQRLGAGITSMTLHEERRPGIQLTTVEGMCYSYLRLVTTNTFEVSNIRLCTVLHAFKPGCVQIVKLGIIFRFGNYPYHNLGEPHNVKIAVHL